MMTDVVGIYDTSYNLLFPDATIIKASVNSASKLMEHPVEDGSTRTDFRIVLPVEITLGIVVASDNYEQVYKDIRHVFSLGQAIIIQTKADVYESQMLQEMPHEESPDTYDSLTLTIKTKEVKSVTTRYVKLPASKVKNKSQQSTKDKGQQNSSDSNSNSNKSLLSRILN